MQIEKLKKIFPSMEIEENGSEVKLSIKGEDSRDTISMEFELKKGVTLEELLNSDDAFSFIEEHFNKN